MYEDNKVSVVRRIVWLVISLLVIAGLVLLLLWLFIWRPHAASTKHTSQPTTGSSQTTTNTTPSDQTNGASNGSASGNTGSTASPNTAPTTPSDQSSTSPSASTPSNSTGSTGAASGTSTTPPVLANTGPGNFVAPVALAIAGGTVYYSVRLRRKLR